MFFNFTDFLGYAAGTTFSKVKKAPSAGAESAFLIVNELPLINFVLHADDHSSQF